MVELIVVIVIAGILATVTTQLIRNPVEMYQAQSRRAQLVDTADTALRRISSEIGSALPNSVRIGCSGRCVEFLQVITGGRYRAAPTGNPFSLSFNPADADTRFEALGYLLDSGSIRTSSGATDCREMAASCVVIYNTGLVSSDAYNMDNAATITAVNSGPPITIDFHNGGFSGTTAFPASSPQQRFFVIDSPVTYLCDIGNGTITRYWGYSIQPSQSATDSHAELTSLTNPAETALLIDNVTDCQFSINPGSATRNALANLHLTVALEGEQVRLFQQLHIEGQP